MADRIREEYEQRIRQLEIEAESSGKPHQRDLYRAIKRMKAELKQYDEFHEKAKRK